MRAARLRRGWSRETLAHESNLSFAAVTQIETGRRTEVRVSTLVALADSLDVSVDHLVRGNAPTSLLEHDAYLFERPDDVAELAVKVATRAIRVGNAVLIVTTESNLDAVKAALGPDASRICLALSSEWYSTPAEATARYASFARDSLEAGAGWIDILGEPVWEGRSTTEAKAWSRYESILNSVFAPWPTTVRCLYDTRSVPRHVLAGVDRTHPEIVTPADRRASDAYQEPADYICN